MSSKPRYVFDTSVIISAFLFHHANPGRALQTALDRGEVFLSIEVAAELNEVLDRDKFDRYLPRKKRKELLSALILEFVFIEVSERIQACRDPKDDKFLDRAVSSQAACLVSSDDDLLVLHPFRGIPIMKPSEFLSWVTV